MEEIVIAVAMLPDGVRFVAGMLGDMRGEVGLCHIEGDAFEATHVHTFTSFIGVEALAVARWPTRHWRLQ